MHLNDYFPDISSRYIQQIYIGRPSWLLPRGKKSAQLR